MPDRTSDVDLFRYHDLTQRLAAFATEGGRHLRGDSEDVQIDPDAAEVALHDGERELARLGGALRVSGSRKTSLADAQASLGPVIDGGGIILVTTERLVIMGLQGTSQLGPIAAGELHTLAVPWGLVDSVAIPARRSLASRIAGARTVELFGTAVAVMVHLVPAKEAEIDGRAQPVTDEEVMRFLARAGATYRLSTGPASDRDRLQAIRDGRFEINEGDRIAVLVPDGGGAPAAPTCAACGSPASPDDRFCGQCGARLGEP